MKVKEIMTKKVVSFKPEDSIKDCIDTLFKMQISGLPVIDENGKLIGMLTEKEIIAKILPGYVENIGKFVYQENPKVVKQKIANLYTLKAKEVMRKEVVTTDEDATLCEVARVIIAQKARRIIVLNKSKEIAGIVARQDVLKALFEEYKV